MILRKDIKKVFVTGGAGFIGSHIVDLLLINGKKVTCFDNLSSGKKQWIEPHLTNKNFRFVHQDLCNLSAVKKAMKGHDLVWHLGANTDIPNGFIYTDIDLKNCVIATRNVLEAMKLNKITLLLFSSTGAVYGETGKIPFEETNGPLLPISLYAAGKLACESFISAYCHLFGLRAWIFRFGNVIGDRMGHGVIHDFIKKLQHDPSQLVILGNGKQAKNYFLVEECIEGMNFIFNHVSLLKLPCDIFNLGTDSRTGIFEIANVITEEMKLKKIRYIVSGSKRGWPGDQPQVFLSVDKVKKLGWKTKHTSTKAVRIATRRMLGIETLSYEK